MINKSELLNSKQAAEYLGISVGTLAVWRSQKRFNIPYIKVGGLVKYRKSALDAFFESREVQGGV